MAWCKKKRKYCVQQHKNKFELPLFAWSREKRKKKKSSSVVIYYKRDEEETLELALEHLTKGHNAVHESILKRVLKEKYGLSLSSTNYTAGTSGYYGRNPYFAFWFPKDNFDYEHPFVKDLMPLRAKIRKTGSVEVRESSGGTIVNINLQGWNT